ncbi:hypothetical protein OC842_001100 [Tilletia horrida]|uniref:Chalcone isomerase domain-containing protein n=1 Tax=Tilletia horrida TaxID=155126 RepID=A0AAN6GIB3_9BASI|nr:hypothetical protein OC842_001100 [Tilletia horrida]
MAASRSLRAAASLIAASPVAPAAAVRRALPPRAAAAAAAVSQAGAQRRPFSSSSSSSSSNRPLFLSGTAISLAVFAAGVAAFYSANAERHRLHLDAPPSSAAGARVGILPDAAEGTRKDPATGTDLPLRLRPISTQTELSLVGLGVRTVSFLKVRVYVAGVYLAESRTSAPRSGPQASAEEVLRNLLDAGTPLVVRIVPVRSTDFNHLRDGFTRSVQARLKAARKAGALGPEADEALARSLQELKALFPPSSLPKGAALDLVVHPVGGSGGGVGGSKARMALTLEHGGKVLGTLQPPAEGSEAAKGGWSVARELVLAYVADKNEISTPVSQSSSSRSLIYSSSPDSSGPKLTDLPFLLPRLQVKLSVTEGLKEKLR